MAQDYEGEPETRPRLWLWILLLLLISFGGGAAAMLYCLGHYPPVARFFRLMSADEARTELDLATRVTVRAPLPSAVPQAAATPDPALAQRIDAIQGKVDGIENQARAATGNASRAEGLLVAFAARRALDRGVELGYIEALLRQRFGQTQPQAVAMILSASRQPVTLADLQNGLDAIAVTLSTNGGAAEQGWWDMVRQQFSGLIVLRRAGEPSSQPADRVARAERMVDSGQVDGALAEILRLPDHAAAARWIDLARRYIIGRSALDRIETAALLDPGPPPLAPPPVPAPPVPAKAIPAATH